MLLDNDNKETLDLGSKNSKADLIAELKARNADTYAKVKSGRNKGSPTNAVTITMLTSLLKAANGGDNIVVHMTASASAPAVPQWNRDF